jgi:predicted aspartyl protease
MTLAIIALGFFAGQRHMRGVTRSLGFGLLSFALASGALPAIAAECGPLQIVTSIPMKPIVGGAPGIDVQIADTRRILLVDTGGVFSAVTKRTVRELKLKPTQSNVAMTNVRGQKSDQAVRLPSIALGTLRQEGAYFQVDPAPDNPDDKNPEPFAGTLGPDLLQKFDADFDFAGHKLNLISPDHCEGKVVYWTAPAVAIVPMHVAQFGHILFPMTLDGKRINVLLDTGASNTTMNLDVARRIFNVDVNAPDVRNVGEITGGYTANVYLRRFKTLEVDGVVVTEPLITLLPNMMGPAPARRTGSLTRDTDDAQGLPDLILGMSVLSKLHVYIAYKESKLYLSAGAPVAGSSP